MSSFERAIAELGVFLAKNDIRDKVRISIVLSSERDKAYFMMGLNEELKPMLHGYKTSVPNADSLTMRGIEIRILA